MMVVREVNGLKLVEYIESAWEGDVNLHVFYDRSLNEKSLENMVRDTHDKILDLYNQQSGLCFLGIEHDSIKIGFIVLNEQFNFLYSFGVRHDFRNRDMLEPIFFYIRKKLKDNFFCLMNECNTRAIRWLKKCGLKEIPSLSPSKDIVYLKYEKCQ
tara:strand:+ start:264 stop:731 length:468 start_codon:yes stop_codon:yes gene_type:complete